MGKSYKIRSQSKEIHYKNHIYLINLHELNISKLSLLTKVFLPSTRNFTIFFHRYSQILDDFFHYFFPSFNHRRRTSEALLLSRRETSNLLISTIFISATNRHDVTRRQPAIRVTKRQTATTTKTVSKNLFQKIVTTF